MQYNFIVKMYADLDFKTYKSTILTLTNTARTIVYIKKTFKAFVFNFL